MAQVSSELTGISSDEWKILARAGGGATSDVWRACHTPTGRICALKTARGDREGAAVLAREAALLMRVERRWGPALVAAGAGFLAVEWTEATPLDTVSEAVDRVHRAAVVAHGIGRALEELHDAGVVHGDVKPANVLLAPDAPERDASAARGATLVDFGLAHDVREAARGGTSRYAAPELRARGEGGLGADLWALGVVIAETFDPTLTNDPSPGPAALAWASRTRSEPARWVEALLAALPAGRAHAGWVAKRAARFLRLKPDDEDAAAARVARVRRTYLNERARDLVPGRPLHPAIEPPARGWIEDALTLRSATHAIPVRETSSRLRAERGLPLAIEPLTALRMARWLVALVGPAAASWPTGLDAQGEGELASRAIALAALRDPTAWSWTDIVSRTAPEAPPERLFDPLDAVARAVRELARPLPSERCLAHAEDLVASQPGVTVLALQLAGALLRAGDPGRAWAALSSCNTSEADAMRAEIARRRGDVETARAAAERARKGGESEATSAANATLARLAWDRGDLAKAGRLLEASRGPQAAEVSALVAWSRGAPKRGLDALDAALLGALDDEARARLEGARGLLLLQLGQVDAARAAFARGAEWASRAGAIVEEATFLTSLAAASSDAGCVAAALESATRSALLWERLDRPDRAARAWLARAATLAIVGAVPSTDEAADEAFLRAAQAKDVVAMAYARLAQVEVRRPGDPVARGLALEAIDLLKGAAEEPRARARLLVWAPDAIAPADIAAGDSAAERLDPAAKWDWWGLRARALTHGVDDAAVVGALTALVSVPGPLGARGPALHAGAALARARGDGAAARRFEDARNEAARLLRAQTPHALLASLDAVDWAALPNEPHSDVTFAPAQVAQLEAIVRALSGRERLRPLLDQVLDTLLLWTGVERGLLLLRSPSGGLVPRSARNLARADLTGAQLALSQSIARLALEAKDAVVATDAFASHGDLHASVHALELRSVLAIPLLARGEALGVVYLDDRVRKGAFGPRELAWVRVVASQAALAIADARDAVLLRRSARSAERARARLESLLRERDAELDVTRARLELVQTPRETRYGYDQIAGRSDPMRSLLRLVDRLTPSDVPVLIVGESGTGKELIARAMHKNGPRAARAFVSENCASVPETLLESTLFGHVRGAFTGASSTRAGLFEIASEGTLFLDEIGEMPLAMQSKLLRVLQDGEVRAVGSERTRKVNVRVICATHRDLAQMVEQGFFREDLLYRLNVVTLRVPPLRERPDDVPALVTHFLHKHAPGREVRVSRAAMTKLVTFPWPGNVRQLENEVRRALVLGEGAIDVGDLSVDLQRGGAVRVGAAGPLNLRERVNSLEAQLLQQALAETRGNQTRAAELLGLSRFGLQKMMKRLGIAPQPTLWVANGAVRR